MFLTYIRTRYVHANNQMHWFLLVVLWIFFMLRNNCSPCKVITQEGISFWFSFDSCLSWRIREKHFVVIRDHTFELFRWFFSLNFSTWKYCIMLSKEMNYGKRWKEINLSVLWTCLLNCTLKSFALLNTARLSLCL